MKNDDFDKLERGEADKIGKLEPEKTPIEKLQNLDFEGEIWGDFLESVQFDIQKKEYVHVVNALFAAAKEDIKQERAQTRGYKYKLEDNPRPDEYTKGFDAVVDGIFNNMNLAMVKELDANKTQEFIQKNKEKLKKDLQAPYAQLKNTLYDVRVFGTGNSNGEKLMKALKVCAKVCINILEPILVIGAVVSLPVGLVTGVALPVVLAAPFVLGAAASVGGFGVAGADHATAKLNEVRDIMTRKIKEQRDAEKTFVSPAKR